MQPAVNPDPRKIRQSDNQAIVNTCLMVFTFGSWASVTCTNTRERAIMAPYFTKSILSLVRGASSLRASLDPVPAQPIPTAMAAPYLK